MIQIQRCNENIINLYKNDFEYSSTKGYTLHFINDLSKEVIITNLIPSTDNKAYTAIFIDDVGCSSTSADASLAELIFPNAGFYTLNILSDNIVAYTERVQVREVDLFIKETDGTTWYSPDLGFTIIYPED